MYDIRWIREHPDVFDRGLKRRGLEPLSAKLIKFDEERRALITKLEQAQARRNAASKEIGQAKSRKDDTTAERLMAEMAELKAIIPDLESKEKTASAELEKELAQIPNMPLDDVPVGVDERSNIEHHKSGAKRTNAFTPKQHFELGEALGQMDFETAAKLSGARFVVLKKSLARMERALGQFMLDLHTGEHGYMEVAPPLLVRDEVMFGTAQLPKFADDQFSAGRTIGEPSNNTKMTAQLLASRVNQLSEEKNENYKAIVEALTRASVTETLTNKEIVNALRSGPSPPVARPREQLWLIPTAEVPLTNLVRESIISEDELPMRLTACTPCFRAEAGAAGKDTRGMIRQHQFTKVELVSITTPEKSKDEHERMLSCAEAVLKKLDLHYRVVTLCTGDMGFAAQKTYDIEVWLPGQNMYREISSCSLCGDFQARRMNARYRPKDGKPVFVHTLNGSGVAVGRALIAVMETYQQEDGSIAVPDVLMPYMGGAKKIERA